MIDKEITCIICPIGCKIHLSTDGTNIKIKDGNKCVKGNDYVKEEVLNPKRVLTSSILVKSGEWPLVSVKTTKPIPKNKILLVLDEIKHTTIMAPVQIGEIILANVADTNIDVVATKSVHKIS